MKEYENDSDIKTEVREFSLRGQTFRAKPRMPGPAFDDLADLQSGRAQTQRLYSTFADIIRRTLIAEDREAWDNLIAADLDVPIDPMTLAEIADDLVAAETGRPTPPLSPSTSSGGSGATRSTDASESPAAQGSTPSHSVHA